MLLIKQDIIFRDFREMWNFCYQSVKRHWLIKTGKICSLTLKDELIGPDPFAMEGDIFLNENTEVLVLNWKSFGSIFSSHNTTECLLAVCLSAAAMGVH